MFFPATPVCNGRNRHPASVMARFIRIAGQNGFLRMFRPALAYRRDPWPALVIRHGDPRILRGKPFRLGARFPNPATTANHFGAGLHARVWLHGYSHPKHGRLCISASGDRRAGGVCQAVGDLATAPYDAQGGIAAGGGVVGIRTTVGDDRGNATDAIVSVDARETTGDR